MIVKGKKKKLLHDFLLKINESKQFQYFAFKTASAKFVDFGKDWNRVALTTVDVKRFLYVVIELVLSQC